MTEKKISLYNISNELRLISTTIEEAGGELTEEVESQMEQLQIELTKKTDGVVDWVMSQDDFVAAIDNRIEELQSLKKRTIEKDANFNRYVVSAMDIMETVKIEGEFSSISIRKPSEIVEIDDENQIPIDYIKVQQKTTKSIDKTAIKKALKAGEEVPGARLATGVRKATFKRK